MPNRHTRMQSWPGWPGAVGSNAAQRQGATDVFGPAPDSAAVTDWHDGSGRVRRNEHESPPCESRRGVSPLPGARFLFPPGVLAWRTLLMSRHCDAAYDAWERLLLGTKSW